MLNKLGVSVKGVILNKVYDEKIAENALKYIQQNTEVEYVESIPKIKLNERGNIPEVELKLEEFCLHALTTIENYTDAEKIRALAQKPEFKGYMDYEEILEKFK